MRRWLIGAFLVLLVTPVAAASPEAELGNLKCVKILIEGVDNDAKSMGLNKDILSDSVLVATRAKAPRLQVKKPCHDVLYLTLTLNHTKTTNGQHTGNYAGYLRLAVARIVTIMATGEISWLAVWDVGTVVSGPNRIAKQNVLDVIEQQVGKFAVDYYKAGNE